MPPVSFGIYPPKVSLKVQTPKLTPKVQPPKYFGYPEMFDYGILQDAGKVSAEIAKLHAETEFEKYRVIQDRLFMSDFDKYMLELEQNVKK